MADSRELVSVVGISGRWESSFSLLFEGIMVDSNELMILEQTVEF
jgi:hypothetical protein